MKEQKKQLENNTSVLDETVTTRIGNIDKYKITLNGNYQDIYFHPKIIRSKDIIEYAILYLDTINSITKTILVSTYMRRGTTITSYIEEKTSALYVELQKGNIPDIVEDSFFIEIIKQNALSKLFNEAKQEKIRKNEDRN